jgi:predicted GNAT family acetyltransferase
LEIEHGGAANLQSPILYFLEGSMSKLTIHDTVDAFLAVAEADLARDEVTNGLMLGVTLRLQREPDRITHKPFLATVQRGDALVAAGVMTPPYGLVVYAAEAEPAPALRLMAESLIAGRWPLPTVNGVAACSHAFAESWRALTGGAIERQVAMRVFELRTVIPPAPVPGHLRPATLADAGLVFDWYEAFRVEAIPSEPAPVLGNVEHSLAESNIYFWEDGGRPVSLAAKSRRTPHGCTIGPVYTPPDVRGRGYASACVAALSQHILDEGKAFCTLFTDLANPTSNHIYQQIGYRPVCDFALYALRALP